jgi:hypothetical protein
MPLITGSIDDLEARNHWGWQHHFDLDKTTEDMLKNLAPKQAV